MNNFLLFRIIKLKLNKLLLKTSSSNFIYKKTIVANVFKFKIMYVGHLGIMPTAYLKTGGMCKCLPLTDRLFFIHAIKIWFKISLFKFIVEKIVRS